MRVPAEGIVVSEESLAESDDRVVASLVSVVNALVENGIQFADLPEGTVLSYYVDFYTAQMLDLGFAQVAHNGGTSPAVAGLIAHGLQAMGAGDHSDLFERQLAVWDALPERTQDKFLDGKPPTKAQKLGKKPGLFAGAAAGVAAELNALVSEFETLNSRADLSELNGAWLRRHPDLVPVRRDRLRPFIAARVIEATRRADAAGASDGQEDAKKPGPTSTD
ncbi:DMP19 family protein [Lysinibacter cavernae]|uniref:DNA mimic protein DMP19 C-terminal domain-containing protein n=1 Tax=Lysinibacter cavernae TaxID=1640652 RepID=A0A7X5R059_9MICO|nr:DMP19 family protein [Lysinibacter cavernae]NIH53194.1 hypothetical protein [Lysinibacter cavernae]